MWELSFLGMSRKSVGSHTSAATLCVAPTFQVLILLAALSSHWGLCEPQDSHPPFGFSTAEKSAVPPGSPRSVPQCADCVFICVAPLPSPVLLRPHTSLALATPFRLTQDGSSHPACPLPVLLSCSRLFSLLPACHTMQFNKQANEGPGHLRSCLLCFSVPLESLPPPFPR